MNLLQENRNKEIDEIKKQIQDMEIQFNKELPKKTQT